ncbi:hypothetical protein PYCCODRAFT_1437436 [Trametes coccinea BRFM310]|uniref:ASX DEUBAD domain-containing protein n=1 Tax=Trametes coccinea (strain BRFM310) TaxID=1353009 RepID=A0A1Y2IGP3_TRAC3|nr:hypothetical protein PYCCODRAFT_1437436 [Trametes coccinea BRFM310]
MDAEAEATSRPVRRSARTPAKPPQAKKNTGTDKTAVPPLAESPAAGNKRKAREPIERSPAEKLDYLLTNSRSKLTQIDIAEVINYTNFLELSDEAQNHLCQLLPPTAFSTYSPSVCTTHPDYLNNNHDAQPSVDRMEVDGDNSNGRSNPATLDPTVFTSPFYLSAAHTFQDHLFSGWLSKKAADDLAKFKEGVRTGQMHADWKDEAWEFERLLPKPNTSKKRKAGRADLIALAKQGLLQQGDILAYKRSFPALNVTVEKDVLVDSVDPQTHSIGFLLTPGIMKSIPPPLLVNGSQECDTKMLSIEDIADPVALERGVLDVDGRVRPSDKYEQDVAAVSGPPRGPAKEQEPLKNVIAMRAWKSFTVWRWREEMRGETELQIVQERGGRERVATLFYLRGCCLSGS